MCPSPGDAPHHGRWHWLIGSPGNGKSAKLGLLARRLLERGYEIVSEDGVAVGESNADWLPYLLEVREQGKPYRFAYLVQDALRRPEPLRGYLQSRGRSRGRSQASCRPGYVPPAVHELGRTAAPL